MQIKGTAFLGRKSMISQEFGEEAWEAFMARQAAKEPFWKEPIFPSTLIPYQLFFDFMEDLADEFYEGDRWAFWRFGEASAQWALTEGPYKSFLDTKDVGEFVRAVFPVVWRIYCLEGVLEGRLKGNVAHVRLKDMPVSHIYFEYTVMGWAKRSLELLGVEKVEAKKIKGFESEDGEIYYQFVLEA